MPYIPQIHQQYPVLYCREHGGEVFQYDPFDLEDIEDRTGEYLVPYGYDSYEDYYSEIDRVIMVIQISTNIDCMFIITGDLIMRKYIKRKNFDYAQV